MPDLFVPIAPAVSPHAAALDLHAERWIRQQRLSARPHHIERWAHSRFGTFAARVCPRADLPSLTLYTEWLTFGFIYDDTFFDESDNGTAIAPIATAVMAAVSAFLPSGTPVALPTVSSLDSSHHLDILDDLIRRTQSIARPEQFHRFCNQMVTWFYSYLYEPSLRAGQRPMPLDGYTANRLQNIAAAPYTTLAEIVTACPITGEEHAEPRLRRLSALAAYQMAWCNDIFSARREADVGNTIENLTSCLEREGRSPAQAMQEAIRIHNATMGAYLSLEAEISPRASAAVRLYLAILRTWMRGHYDWCRATARYNGE
ncbi:hypothetical protein CTZ27_11655 [Streptomyces griseocarneus]|nr:hypothetical protein CTZ27_11655 [Streptomyces griseocarneus]